MSEPHQDDHQHDDHQHDDHRLDDHTVDADPDTLDTIRRLATQAAQTGGQSPVASDHTVDADDSTLDQIRQLAERAARRAESGADAGVDAGMESGVVSGSVDMRIPTPLPDWTKMPPSEPARKPVRPAVSEEPWRPPARSVRLEPDQRRTDTATHKWRLATGVLAVLVVLLLVWMLFGGDSDPIDSPTDTTINGGVPAGTPVTGSVGEGGAGG